MARINIEEKWLGDPRRKLLIKRLGNERLADGMLVEIARMIINHKGNPIPLSEFSYVENCQDWIDCGLARVENDAVQIVGTSPYRDFFEKQKANGQLGGRPPNPRKPKETQNNPEEPNHKPKNPSPSSSSSSSSSEKPSAGATLSRACETGARETIPKGPGTATAQVVSPPGGGAGAEELAKGKDAAHNFQPTAPPSGFAPVARELCGNPNLEFALKFVPQAVQWHWLETYEVKSLNHTLLNAVSHHLVETNAVNAIGVEDWARKLLRWVKDEKKTLSPKPRLLIAPRASPEPEIIAPPPTQEDWARAEMGSQRLGGIGRSVLERLKSEKAGVSQ